MNISLFVIGQIKSLLGIDAFISADFTQITVDEDCFIKYPQRTRFSIAHEIGHLILHKDWYSNYGPKNLSDYLSFPDRIDLEAYKHIEIQAQTFAGLVLVPTDLLISFLKNKLGRIPQVEAPEVLAPIVQDLPELFQVSDAVILRRLQIEKIVKSNF